MTTSIKCNVKYKLDNGFTESDFRETIHKMGITKTPNKAYVFTYQSTRFARYPEEARWNDCNVKLSDDELMLLLTELDY